MPRVIIVIPCYNEADRLDTTQVLALAANDDVQVLLVDDGSSDGTLAILEQLASEHPASIDVLALETNGGKSEAVRRGLLDAAPVAEIVGYCDADFATPVSEMLRLLERMDDGGVDVVTGARIARLGAAIERRPARHYFGRIFATAASLALGQAVYDTQCGAKLFRSSPALSAAIAEPFHSRWAFDVELLGRLLANGASVLEVPLRAWHDVGGSKLKGRDMLRAGLDLLTIARSLRTK